jgi:hypothetical protein
VSIKDRLRAAERHLGLDRPAPPPPPIFIHVVRLSENGGLHPNQTPDFANVGSPDGPRFDRVPGESERDFNSRILTSVESRPDRSSIIFLDCYENEAARAREKSS